MLYAYSPLEQFTVLSLSEGVFSASHYSLPFTNLSLYCVITIIIVIEAIADLFIRARLVRKSTLLKMIPLIRTPFISIAGMIFILSPTETSSFQPTLIGYLIPVVLLTVLFFLVYRYIYHKERFIEQWSYIFGHFKSGFVGYGMPKWWMSFSASYLGIFIRYVGSICFIVTRSILPYNPEIAQMATVYPYNYLTFFIYFMAVLFILYTFTFLSCSLRSTLKYLFNLKFIVRNSPLDKTGTFINLAGSVLKGLGIFGAGVGTLAGTVTAVEEIQTKVFRASEDQLATTYARKAVDYAKDASGYSSRSANLYTPVDLPKESKIKSSKVLQAIEAAKKQ